MWHVELNIPSGFVLNIAELPYFPLHTVHLLMHPTFVLAFLASVSCFWFTLNLQSDIVTFSLWTWEFLEGRHQKPKPPCAIQGVWSSDPSSIWILSLYLPRACSRWNGLFTISQWCCTILHGSPNTDLILSPLGYRALDLLYHKAHAGLSSMGLICLSISDPSSPFFSPAKAQVTTCPSMGTGHITNMNSCVFWLNQHEKCILC